MNQIQLTSLAYSDGSSALPIIDSLAASKKLALLVAMGATLASFGIAMNVGWQSGGLLMERVLRAVLACIAVLAAHWLPSNWSTFRGMARIFSHALWFVAIVVVLSGQATFLIVAQGHAGDLRAAAVSASAVPESAGLHLGRSRTEIAKAMAKASADLARAQMQSCVSDCPTLKVRRIRLAADVAALGVEADEAKRRDSNEDWRKLQVKRDDERREASRADPVAVVVASWFGTTENVVLFVVNLAYAVVLEGAAILCWAYVTVTSDRNVGRVTIAQDSLHEIPDPSPEGEAGLAILSEEDEILNKIHAAVSAEKLNPTQAAIRKFLQCGQQKAAILNRKYAARFGGFPK